MNSTEYNQLSIQSFDFGCKIIKEQNTIKQSIELLNSSIVNCPDDGATNIERGIGC